MLCSLCALKFGACSPSWPVKTESHLGQPTHHRRCKSCPAAVLTGQNRTAKQLPQIPPPPRAADDVFEEEKTLRTTRVFSEAWSRPEPIGSVFGFMRGLRLEGSEDEETEVVEEVEEDERFQSVDSSSAEVGQS